MSPSRYLLIEFDDEASASLLRERIDKATRSGKKYRVIGLFAKPTKFCRCGTWVTNRGTNSTLERGEKFGWFVCTTCKRAAPMMTLRNLLMPRDVISPPKYDIVGESSSAAPQKEVYGGFHPNSLSLQFTTSQDK